jgi:hypothetical protein
MEMFSGPLPLTPDQIVMEVRGILGEEVSRRIRVQETGEVGAFARLVLVVVLVILAKDI